MADNVEVFNVGGGYADNLGQTVLPASIQPIDFSVLDRAIQTEQEIQNRSLNTMMTNLQTLGKIQDDLTGIQVSNPHMASRLESAKKANGLTNEAFANALTGIQNPVAMYDLDRKMKSLATDPTVRTLMQENAAIDVFRQNLPTIADPSLRAMAAQDLTNVLNDTDGTYTASSLNLDAYKPIDLSSAYMAVVEMIAPKTQSDEVRKDPSGATYVETITSRDPELLRRSRDLFMKNHGVMNNLKARGIIDEKGEFVLSDGKSFFDLLEEGLSKTSRSISSYTPPPKPSKTSTTISDPGSLLFDRWTPNVSSGFDLGLISQAETGGRATDSLVHVDPGNEAINMGAFSFNGGPDGGGKRFIKWLIRKYPDNETLKQLDQIDLTSKSNLDKVKELYSTLDSDVSGLSDDENAYVIESYGTPIINAATKAGISELGSAERTVLLDSAIQHGVGATEKWLTEYSKLKDPEDLIDFITSKRSKLVNGKYANRAYTVAQGAKSIAAQNEEQQTQVDLSSWGLE